MQNLTTTALSIGALAERTGLNVPTIRYYEEIGLIPEARRRPSGHRYYDGNAEELLGFIRHCREFGFPIEQVRELVSLSTSVERDCFETRDIAQRHLDSVRGKLAELRVLEQSLSRFVKSCTNTCAGGAAAQCTIFSDLSSAIPGEVVKAGGCCP